MQDPFSVNIVYGLGFWLKDYGYYPKHWPLYSYMDHGITLHDTIPPHELNNEAPIIFKFSPRLVELYKKQSTKPVFPILNPYIHYRHKHKICKSENAANTLFFPAHSTDEIDDATDWQDFINRLKTIPPEFGGIDICLHPTDMKKGLDRVFGSQGYKVFTAGNPYDPAFTQKMYAILRNYKYTMSNIPGSYLFYSVEMGIPFSLFGNEPLYHNLKDPNVEKGQYTSYKQNTTYQKAVALFSGSNTTITADQAAFVDFELGKTSSISRMKTCFLLYKAAAIYLYRHPEARRPFFSSTYKGAKAYLKQKFR